MITANNSKNPLNNPTGSDNLLLDSIKILTDLTQKDIERSYSIENIHRTENLGSNRYTRFLRKFVS